LQPFLICAIADGEGMGDDVKGSTLSRRAVLEFVREIETERFFKDFEAGDESKIKANFNKAFARVNEKVLTVNREYQMQGHTTLTGVVIAGSRIYVGNVGNCQVFLANEDGIKPLIGKRNKSSDPHFAPKYKDEGSGAMLPEVVGRTPILNVDFYSDELDGNDYIVLATDGFYENITEEKIHFHLRRGNNLKYFCKNTVQGAAAKSSKDDILVMAFKLEFDKTKLNKAAISKMKKSITAPLEDSGKAPPTRAIERKPIRRRARSERGIFFQSVFYAILFILCFFAGLTIYTATGGKTKKPFQAKGENVTIASSSSIPGLNPDNGEKWKGFKLSRPDDIEIEFTVDGEESDISAFSSLTPDKMYKLVIKGQGSKKLYSVRFLASWDEIEINQWKSGSKNEILYEGKKAVVSLTRGSRCFVEAVEMGGLKMYKIKIDNLGSDVSLSMINCKYMIMNIVYEEKVDDP